MNKNLTDITILVDKSGSMASIRADAIGGINTLVAEQKKLSGEANFTLIQFNTKYELVHNAISIQNVPEINLVPSGGTALLDAIAKAIIDTGKRLSSIPESERPSLVVFCIVTDGEENSSKISTLQQVKEMIQHQENVFNWKFQYLAANQDAIKVGGSMGIQTSVDYAPRNTRQLYAACSNSIGRMRSQTSKGLSAENYYSKDEIVSLTD